MKIVSVVNQKGGVGKTTTVVNLGAALAALGKKVLLVDLDPQGNLTAGLGVDQGLTAEKSTYFAITGQSFLYYNVVDTDFRGLFCVPTDSNLAGAEIELVNQPNREYSFKNSLSDDLALFDYIFIDCPPSLGLLTINALTASHQYLLPLQAEFYALQGFSNMLKTIDAIRQNFNPELDELGVLFTMVDPKTRLSKEVQNEVRAFAGDRVFANVIPRRVKLSESASHGKPGVIYDPSCYGSRSYVEVAKEIILRGQGIRLEKPAQSFIPPDPVDRIGRSDRLPNTLRGPDRSP